MPKNPLVLPGFIIAYSVEKSKLSIVFRKGKWYYIVILDLSVRNGQMRVYCEKGSVNA